MRLTSDLLARRPPTINCIGERELCLRDLAIPQIENLALTQNAVDTIDLSNNLISEVSTGFPPLSRVTTLYLGNNRIARIGNGLAASLPNLIILVLTGNSIQNVADLNLNELGKFKNLEVLSVVDNPVENVKGIRDMVVKAIPTMKMFNFHKIKEQERIAARKSQGKDSHQLGKRKLAHDVNEKPSKRKKKDVKLAPEVEAKVRDFIANAKTITEISAIQEAMRRGTVVQFLKANGAKTN